MVAGYLKEQIADLRRFSDFARLDATGANFHPLNASLRSLDSDRLQVGIKAPARAVVCVRDIIAELRSFATDFASFSHDC